MSIGSKIKRIRIQKHISQKQLAETLGYKDKSMICKIEKNVTKMSYEKMLLFMKKYDLSASELFQDALDIIETHSKILTIQDVSCFGQCSITVALPILSACGYETAILPTSILSTHTSGFKDFVAKDLDEQMHAFAAHWKKEGLKFDVVYTGYLGSVSLIDFAISAVEDFKKENALVFVDPALGDRGKLYPVFDTEYAIKMRELLAKADVIKPNITEACFITETPYQEKYDEAFVKLLIGKLKQFTNATIVLTDVSFTPGTTGVYIYENKQFKYYKHQKLGDGYHGTGDIFSASFVAAMLKTHSIYSAAKMAADYVYRCIKVTLGDNSHWYGVKFEQLLNDFVNRINNKKGK